jgi:hypothetical protein
MTVTFGRFGDLRDEHPNTHMYQPEGSKHRFELQASKHQVTARKIGKPDEVLPGGRAVKSLAAGMFTWSGGTGSPEGHQEVLNVAVRKGYQGLGLAKAMLHLSNQFHPNLSHSAALSAEGARFAARNPLPGDTPATKATQASHLKADAATAMLGGPRRTGYI